MANEEQELRAAEADWKKHLGDAAAWCAAHRIPVKVGPAFVVQLESVADVLEGAIAAAGGPDSVPDGVPLYMICVRETANFIRLHGQVDSLAAIARLQVEHAQESAQAPALPARKHARRRVAKKASK